MKQKKSSLLGNSAGQGVSSQNKHEVLEDLPEFKMYRDKDSVDEPSDISQSRENNDAHQTKVNAGEQEME